MLWGLILQGLALVQVLMGYLVTATYHFNIDDTGQWNITTFSVIPTTKGNAIMTSVATLMHYGLDFLAQLTLLLPAVASTTYVTGTASMLTVP